MRYPLCLDDLTRLLREIMQEARSLTKAERSVLYFNQLRQITMLLCNKVFHRGSVNSNSTSNLSSPIPFLPTPIIDWSRYYSEYLLGI